MPGEKIIVVEDELLVAQDIQFTLENMGYVVPVLCETGEKALVSARDYHPHLILMDIMLKGSLDGITTAEMIRKDLGIPIIYLTAFEDRKTLDRARLTEPYGYLLKPFVDKELHATIEMALYKHEAERKIKERENWLYTILERIADAVIVSDNNYKITFINETAESFFHQPKDNLINKDMIALLDTVSPYFSGCVDGLFRKMTKSGLIQEFNLTLPEQKPDNKEIFLEGKISPIHDDQGEVRSAILIFHDMSEKRRMEQEVRKIQKLESLGILAGGIAHDFNNILTSILGNISLARLKAPDNIEAEGFLDASEKACFQAQELTQQLMTFSKGGNPLRKIQDVSELIRKTATFSLAGTNIKPILNIDDHLDWVNVDSTQFFQVIQNLVINAREAMPLGGNLLLEAKNRELKIDTFISEQLSALHPEPGRYIVVSVQDQGMGIDPKFLPNIFDPYFTTKKKGSGLGLAITYSIIKKHNGYITVDSRLGKGTKFSIYMPSENSGIIAAEIKPRLYMGKGKVLVVEEDDNIRLLLERILETLGYQGVFASTYQESIAIFRTEKFDLIIADLTVRGNMQVRDFSLEIKKIDPNALIILSSGYSNDPQIINFSSYGYAGVLIKPFKIEDISIEINRILVHKPEETSGQ